MIAVRAASTPFDEEYWKSKALNVDLARAKTGTHDQYSIDLPFNTRDGSFDRAASGLFRYQVFPPTRMHAQVCTPDARIVMGATIVQRVLLGPLAMEMGVRVVEIIDEATPLRRAGFTYATLEGHAERGVAMFSMRERTGAPAVFEIESWSRPGNVLAWLGRPFARLVQRSFTREALSHFRSRAVSGTL